MAPINTTLDAIPKRKFGAGEFIIIQDTRPNGIFFLTHGAVDVIMDGQRITKINQLGSIFGEMAYFLDNVSSASIQCAVDSEFLHIENPKEFFRENPEVIQNITKIMCSRIINLSKQIAMLKRGSESVGHAAEEEMLKKVLNQNPPGDDDDIVIF